MSNYVLVSISDKEGNPGKFQELIGEVVTKISGEVGRGAIIFFENDNNTLYTSNLESIVHEGDKGIYTTMNSVYTFQVQ